MSTRIEEIKDIVLEILEVIFNEMGGERYGAALCFQEVVNKYSGNIHVISDGKGTYFRVVIPLGQSGNRGI
ncbi:hypothetical protein [Pelosinus sp. IPA-1]|uniref:ATP-binding protein n=1 Tax=Pelosinus sp. IPA-1 TaxID=3029569 RepID=UPI00243619FF|nr:hypothetical protein [Pelosinus sp. IPA-1]GMA98718.1 hypothetical protein PIPA1_15180 [Pelosinus sp. IPA-1]